MDHKNLVSGTGDGVLLLDILMKHAKCTGCRFSKKSGISIFSRFKDGEFHLLSPEFPTIREIFPYLPNTVEKF